MVARILTLSVLLAGCQFEVPAMPNARQACQDWFDALEQRSLECGESPEEAQAVRERVRPWCDRVISVQPDIYEKCIYPVPAIACDQTSDAKCAGFEHI